MNLNNKNRPDCFHVSALRYDKMIKTGNLGTLIITEKYNSAAVAENNSVFISLLERNRPLLPDSAVIDFSACDLQAGSAVYLDFEQGMKWDSSIPVGILKDISLNHAVEILEKAVLCSRIHTDTAVSDRIEEFSLTRPELLVGAGSGLTPSGDDFIAGVLNALAVTGHSSFSRFSKTISDKLGCTTALSARFLTYAIEKRAAETVICLFNSILYNVKSLKNDAEKVVSFGHYSGLYLLKGIIWFFKQYSDKYI